MNLFFNKTKKVLIFSLLIMFVSIISSNISNATDCPPGMDGPYTTTITIGDCIITFDWCCNRATGTNTDIPIIYFGDIRINPLCSSLPSYVQPDGQVVPTIPWNEMIAAVLTSQTGCFNIPLPIFPCPSNDFTVRVLNGGCYRFVYTVEYIGYIRCDPNSIEGLCFQFYYICYEYINNQFKVKITSGPPAPTFNCTGEGCYPRCY